MADTLTPAQRRRVMARIKGKDTAPEHMIRRGLHRMGFRFRLHRSDLPGRPDLTLPQWRAVIFVNGCFWHGHDCPMFRVPATRAAYWWTKTLGNRARDGRNARALLDGGWRALTIWECALRGRWRLPPGAVLWRTADWIRHGPAQAEIAGRSPDGPTGEEAQVEARAEDQAEAETIE